MEKERSSGILLHITSLPGKSGIGTIGDEAYRFVEFLVAAGQKYWQILPVGPVLAGFGYSPYSSYSSFAGNPLLIDLNMIQKKNWARENFTERLKIEQQKNYVNFDRINTVKAGALETAADIFFKYSTSDELDEFNLFCRENDYWLHDFAVFSSISEYFNTFEWNSWEKTIRERDKKSLKIFEEKLKNKIRTAKFIQFIFFRQWNRLKKYCSGKNIKMIGDIPIYVNFDSADVWANPGVFMLDDEMRPTGVSGVPPDYFSESGQKWGNPLYNWGKNKNLNPLTLKWWKKRVKHISTLVDLVRIDHFRGFESFWQIPPEEKNGKKGKWVPGPGIEFFNYLKRETGYLPFIAEDLGMITKEVEILREKAGMPGMKILQFAFDGNPDNPYLPKNFVSENCVAYTGTHDNNTVKGWISSEVEDNERDNIFKLTNTSNRDLFHWDFIKIVMSSKAYLAIIPFQDILGLDEEARFNTPGTVNDNNWRWKMKEEDLSDKVAEKLSHITKFYGR